MGLGTPKSIANQIIQIWNILFVISDAIICLSGSLGSFDFGGIVIDHN